MLNRNAHVIRLPAEEKKNKHKHQLPHITLIHVPANSSAPPQPSRPSSSHSRHTSIPVRCDSTTIAGHVLLATGLLSTHNFAVATCRLRPHACERDSRTNNTNTKYTPAGVTNPNHHGLAGSLMMTPENEKLWTIRFLWRGPLRK